MLLHPLTLARSAAAIAELAGEQRLALAEHWRRRARSEARIGAGFTVIAGRGHALGVDEALCVRFEEAAAEEAEHATLCEQLAALYDAPLPDARPVPALALDVPCFGTSDDRLELCLLVLGTCCINETLASTYLGTCLEVATVPCAREANRRHLREEIGHGRLGWALLASTWVDDGLRRALEPHIPAMLAANVPLWTRIDPCLGVGGLPSFGHPEHARICARIEDAVEHVVLRGLAHVGLRSDRAP